MNEIKEDMSKPVTYDKALKMICKPTQKSWHVQINDNKVDLSQQTKFYVTMNKSFHIRVSSIYKQKQCECPFRNTFQSKSYYIVTSQLIYNANELVVFYLTKVFTKKCF